MNPDLGHYLSDTITQLGLALSHWRDGQLCDVRDFMFVARQLMDQAERKAMEGM